MNTLRFERWIMQWWYTLILLLCLFGVSSLPQMRAKSAAADGTFQDFNTPGIGTPYAVKKAPESMRAPELFDNPPISTDKLMRLAFAAPPIPTHNSIAFDRTASGAFDQIVADFDFRMSPGKGRADGLGFSLLNTTEYGVSGPVDPQGVAEEPNFARSLGIGFDIYKSSPPPEISNNHLSIHFNGTLIREFDVTPAMDLDLAGGQWIHARIIMRPGGGYSDITLILTECGRASVTVINQFKVSGFTPYEGRVYFAARSGYESADHDIDNIRVNFLSLEESVISFNNGCYTAVETDGSRLLTITRTGNLNSTASVHYVTANLLATAPSDYRASSGTLTFNAGQTTKTLSVPIVNDSNSEPVENFLVSLSSPSTGTSLGGPAVTKVTIADSTTAQTIGHWSEPIRSDVVAIHMHLLPTGQVLYWDRHSDEFGWDGNPRLWDPTTGTISMAGMPGYDIFCSGHSFLADGRLLVTGGHVFDQVGENKASIYDPFTNSWTRLPNMNAGRWYPSNVTLANGDTLVLAGTFNPGQVNPLPQVWQNATGTWRNLTSAQITVPSFADYYPFLYLAPNGKIFDAGPQKKTYYLDTSGSGHWTEVAESSQPYRDYGSSVMYDDGKVLIVGGNERGDTILPEASAEVINLNENPPVWRRTADMHDRRRQLNTTLLPDGKVLVTGGSSAAGFDTPSGEALTAELWDPVTGVWTVMASQTRYRGYHSSALLLPDGRVLVGGGGHPDPVTGAEYSFEIYSPPYLFKGTRPVITSAPSLVGYGEQFVVKTSTPATIAQVTLVRLSSVTHSFNQNQRFKRLNFAPTSGGLAVTVPANPNSLPPGPYMLFILDGRGVPSVGRMIRISNDVTVSIRRENVGELSIPPQDSQRVAYPINNGVVEISSNVKIIAAEREIYKANNISTSFSEMMGLPGSQLDNIYWLPWYNNVDLDTQLRFGNVTTNQTATVKVYIHGREISGSCSPTGPYTLAAGASLRVSCAGVNNGPVKIESTQPIVADERVIYTANGPKTSFTEMMALPNKQLDNTYWLPWYNSVDLDTQLRFGNVTFNQTAKVRVWIGGKEISDCNPLNVAYPYVLVPGQSLRVSCPTVNNGPVKIQSNIPIVAAERVIYKFNGVNTSFTEMMALPNTQLDSIYWLPWYNNAELDTQIRFGNVSTNQTATVHIFIGGQEMLSGCTPYNSPYTLAPGASLRVSCADVNSGPVQIKSNIPIVAAERVIFKVNNISASFSEMMGLPDSQLDTAYWLPWYNNVDLDTQLRFGVP